MGFEKIFESNNLIKPKKESDNGWLSNKKEGPEATESPTVSSPIFQEFFFDPFIEVRKILQLPTAERRTKLREFQNRLVCQKTGIAEIENFLIDKIRNNPDTSYEELYKIVEDLGQRYGLAEWQKNIFKRILEVYKEKHELVKQIRSKFPNDTELYSYLFSKKPKGKIEIITGPIMFYIRCYDIEDYAFLSSGAFIDGREITLEDIERAKITSGMVLARSRIEGLRYCIVIENTSFLSNKDKDLDLSHKNLKINQIILNDYLENLEMLATLLHEEQHVIYRLITETLDKEGIPGWRVILNENVFFAFFENYKKCGFQEDKQKRRLLERFFRVVRMARYEELAKNEILAFFKSSSHPAEIRFYLFSGKGNDGVYYDWFARDKEEICKILKLGLGSRYDEDEHLIEAVMQKIFVDDYCKIINNGIDVFLTFQEKGFSLEQTIAILAKEQLSKWPKVVKRFFK